ncbi:MAG TPA: helicase-associated domain-containing protein [Candidatus Methylomirabilis sp.]|nr:helicase-associated domain-containing protein [Candidatus Methylomirabilis sp.]
MPDFQRPAGDYDSWFIRQETSGEYLRGFESWEEVDGAVIRFIITGPLHWLGILDLASASQDGIAAAFRFSSWAGSLLEGKAPAGLPAETASLQLHRDGRLVVPHLVPRAARYQLARFAIWEGEEKGSYRYRLTPTSLERARDQGLRVAALIHLLRKHASSPPPPVLVQALERWEISGTQAHLEPLLVLRLGSPEILAALRRSRAARFLGEPLGATAVIIPAGARDKVLAALAELGYLAEAGFIDGGDV